MKKIITFSIILAISILFSCTKNYNEEMQDSESLFYKGKYKEAARQLLPSINKKSRNQLLYMMECGMMLHSGQDYENSNNVFLAAEKLYPEIGISISKQTASILLNESKTNYRGENFEKVLIHMYAGINFLMMNKIESARVEFKKVNNLLQSFKLENNKKYDQNILAKYLTAVCYETLGDIDKSYSDWEYAYIEYKQIYQLNRRLPGLGQDLMRTAFKLKDNQELAKWRRIYGNYNFSSNNSDGNLMVLFHGGKGVIKKSRGKLLADANMNMAIRIHLSNISLQQGVTIAGVLASLSIAEHPIPKFVRRTNKTKYIDIYSGDKLLGRTFLTDDLSKTAFLNMQDKYSKVIKKTAVGIAVKAVAALAAAYTAQKIAEQSKSLGPVAGLIGAATGAAVGTGFASQIKPDLRCWHTLPDTLQFFKTNLPEGDHDLTLNFIGAKGNLLETRKQKVTIKKGKDQIINIRTVY